jgi:two-component system, OmpR family, phosphate regulon sensor histidine kinase PhoR
MSWWLPRMLIAATATLIGGVVGIVVSDISGISLVSAPLFGACLGCTCALGVVVMRDTLRGYRLITWLRGSQEGSAPRSPGMWGELGYRIERSFRSRENSTTSEQERLAQFLSAIEASPNGVMLLDADDQIEWLSTLAADHFGLNPLRDRHQHVTNLVRTPAFVQYLQAEQFDEVVQMPDPSGRSTLSVQIRPYGEGLKLVLSQDITERERSEGMRRDFVANVSHEIRTPLTVLSGFIETMIHLQLQGDERRRVLELMTQQAGRMSALVADLLTLAQLEGSPRPHADRWITLQPLLDQVALDANLLSAGRHTLEVATHVNAQIAGSPTELRSAVTNLVNNAVRYTPAGGRVTVSWKRLADGSGELAVTDTGPGIAREHLPRLTERFYRVDSSRSRDTGGTGLGLSIVKHVAQRHSGQLKIHSELGFGATFQLLFPATRVRTENGNTMPVASTKVYAE